MAAHVIADIEITDKPLIAMREKAARTHLIIAD